jgi:hypothetical protein
MGWQKVDFKWQKSTIEHRNILLAINNHQLSSNKKRITTIRYNQHFGAFIVRFNSRRFRKGGARGCENLRKYL